jgi:hypothetical protein
MPGRTGDYAGDLAVMLGWRPSLVLTLAETGELCARGAAALPHDLAAAGVLVLPTLLVELELLVKATTAVGVQTTRLEVEVEVEVLVL